MRQRKDDTRGDDGKPYGYVLILRALARAAIILGQYDATASLRVLCVLAEYADQAGRCRVGQDTIAARLGISRQAVGKHIGTLLNFELIEASAKKPGIALSYEITVGDLADGRFAVEEVAKRREALKAAKPNLQPNEVAGQKVEHLQPNEVADLQRQRLQGVQRQELQEVQRQRLHEETSSEISSRDFQKRGADAPLPDGRGDVALTVPIGFQVRHTKFGLGTVAGGDGHKVCVDFESGQKWVLASFLEVLA